MSEAQELQNFHKLCEVSVIVEEDGTNPVLCVSANVRDRTTGEFHEFKRCVSLAPLMRMLADRIREYHDNLHDEMNVSGESAGVLEGMGLPPGIDPLMVGAWYDRIRKTARNLAEGKAVKTLYKDLKTYGTKASTYAKKGASWAAAHKDHLAMASAIIPGGGPLAAAALKTGFKAYDAVKAARDKNPEALAALRKIRDMAENGDLKAAEALRAAKNMNDMLNAKEQSETEVSGPWHHTNIMDSDVVTGQGFIVNGWLYNRPYRTNAQVLMDAGAGKFPTVSLAMRQGWHDGLDFIASMKRKNINILGM